MTTTTPTSYSKTGKAYPLDMHQLQPGDLLLWNDRWYTVQTVTRNPAVKLSVTAHLYSETHGHGTAMGEECQQVTYVPRIYAEGQAS